MLTWDTIQSNAYAFAKRWQSAKSENSESQSFITRFLAIFGIDDPTAVGRFEKLALRQESHGFMDYFLPKKIAIEMKSKGKDLSEAYKQLKEYVVHIPDGEMPELLMVSDFATIVLYNRTTGKRTEFKTKDLHKHVKRFATLAGYTAQRDQDRDEQFEITVRAAEKMAKLHDALLETGYGGHDLEIYLVRLLFCLFAGDTGIFPKGSFYNYVHNSKEDGSDLAERIGSLFEILNMPDDVRAKKTLLSNELKEFRFINGKLFNKILPRADFNQKMRQILMECRDFDWSNISPAIFGAMFQGVMNKDLRRELGAHYTSEENILKVVNPLCMDDLWKEFERVKADTKLLNQFHDKIAKLKFLDPACGCGNFLIVTYRELRLLEIEILKMQVGRVRQKRLDISTLMKVNIEQFYGIEIEDFPCQVATVGMWLVDHQMNLRIAEEFGQYHPRLPLKQCATVVHGNALRIDWEDVVPKNELSYILGNPPFVGHQYRNARQQEDMQIVYKDSNKFGKLDYVCCWYHKAIGYMKETQIRAAFVSTNSIVQGETVAIMWKPIFDQGVEVNFAYTPFVWTNEAKGKAVVHCVIIGFSLSEIGKVKRIFSKEVSVETDNINGYLLPAPNVFIQSRGKPLATGMPEMSKGSQPTDGGNLIFSIEERKELIAQCPQAKKWLKRYISADEFINNNLRYCLWLKGVASTEYRSIKPIMQRLERVADMRKSSPTVSVQRDAEKPMLFTQIRQPETPYLVIPETSSERRKYIPIGFLLPDVICSNAVQIVRDATLYSFGILMSIVHMAWTRVVCGRLEMRYRYTPAVYNNFPWPDATDDQKAKIEELAQAVLDARGQFPNSSLADLYDPLTMPPELLKAHQNLDRAVMKLYGFKTRGHVPLPESEIVAKLMEMYQQLTTKPTMLPEEETKKKRKKRRTT